MFQMQSITTILNMTSENFRALNFCLPFAPSQLYLIPTLFVKVWYSIRFEIFFTVSLPMRLNSLA